ncbi:transposase, partial [Desulfocurvibacter africanus]
VRKARADRAARDYTPPAELPQIISELDKYEYLFGLAQRDGLELREADREWMANYEATEEYREVAANRFERLARLYARRRAKA